jgi:hypothetical protein
LLFYYLAMVQRGSDKGLPRDASQTPKEYSDQLTDYLTAQTLVTNTTGKSKKDRPIPGSLEQTALVDGISHLTEGFIQARYSKHDIADDQASTIRRYWVNIMKVLQKWR